MSTRRQEGATSAVEVVLPHGFPWAGAWRRTVWLRPWGGTSQELASEALSDTAPMAARATSVLGRCLSLDGSTPAAEAFARQLTAGDREAALLELHRVIRGPRLEAVLTCEACAEKLELELQVDDLLVPPYEAPRTAYECVIQQGDLRCLVRFRLPTGADQEAAAPLARRDPAAAAEVVLERCILALEPATPELRREAAERLPALMAELDPQAEVLLAATCPACQQHFEALFDGAAFVLAELERARQRLFREVHRLALHYHWSESDILALGDARRRRYLALLQHELEGERGA